MTINFSIFNQQYWIKLKKKIKYINTAFPITWEQKNCQFSVISIPIARENWNGWTGQGPQMSSNLAVRLQSYNGKVVASIKFFSIKSFIPSWQQVHKFKLRLRTELYNASAIYPLSQWCVMVRLLKFKLWEWFYFSKWAGSDCLFLYILKHKFLYVTCWYLLIFFNLEQFQYLGNPDTT